MKQPTLTLLFFLVLFGNLVAQVSFVKDIVPGPGDGFQDNAKAGIAYNSKYLFAANGMEGNELWISDGTSDGTTILKDIIHPSVPTLTISLSSSAKSILLLILLSMEESCGLLTEPQMGQY